MFSVQLADVLTRCSSHRQGKIEARCEKCWCFIGVANVLACPCSLAYVSGVSEQIRKACQKYNLKVVFKSGPSFRSLLTKVKDPLPKEKLAGVVHQIPCQCGKVYVGKHGGT